LIAENSELLGKLLPQLVDLSAEILQQRLIEAERKPRHILRIERGEITGRRVA